MLSDSVQSPVSSAISALTLDKEVISTRRTKSVTNVIKLIQIIKINYNLNVRACSEADVKTC